MAKKDKKAFLKEKLGEMKEKCDSKGHEKEEGEKESKMPFAKFKKLGKK